MTIMVPIPANPLDFPASVCTIWSMSPSSTPHPQTARFGEWLIESHRASDRSMNGPTHIKWVRSDIPSGALREMEEAEAQEALCAELNRAVGAAPNLKDQS